MHYVTQIIKQKHGTKEISKNNFPIIDIVRFEAKVV